MNPMIMPFSNVPLLPFENFRNEILNSVNKGARIGSFFGIELENTSSQPIRIIAVLLDDQHGTIEVLSANPGESYPALTPECPQAHMFERELAEQYGVIPDGHPWLRPARFHPSFRKNTDKAVQQKTDLIGVADFFRIDGEEIHEVAVGPVHAGVIEPGHFRFQCHGEKVFHLEISLGYQHRGIEKALMGGPGKRSIYQIETLAGDTTIGHTIAYCQIIESLKRLNVPERGHALRAVALELERFANHTGDLGALAGDVGFLPTSAFCGRIRGDFLNMTALLCGSRLGRGFVRPGGTAFDIDTVERLEKMSESLKKAEKDTNVAIQLIWDSSAIMSRFETTGTVKHAAGISLGLVGPAARACGNEIDVRQNFPFGQYLSTKILPGYLSKSGIGIGDVAARAYIRGLEIQNSFIFLKELLPKLPSGNTLSSDCKGPEANQQLAANSLVVSLVEGWRGEICHTAITDSRGQFIRYKVVDPSFHNWIGLGLAMRNQAISDFPLCNKSFNLSYCGFDL
ncbi:MAG: NADH-quinone oxidoreductase subunit C [Candidatus Riflebacteria bacterium]|nr:NADH-quinone oxidoreductase subunit C [Candidatus Riflebacteria bacterium]